MNDLFTGNVHLSPQSPRHLRSADYFSYRGVKRGQDETDVRESTLLEGGEDTGLFGEGEMEKRGRKKLWTPLKLSKPDLEARDDFLKKYGTTKKAQERVCADYLEFCRLNQCSPKFSLGDCVGQWHALGCYRPGTMDTYSGYIYAQFGSAQNKIARVACQRWNAANDVQHAPDYAFEILKELAMQIEDPLYRMFATILLVSGLRPVALTKMMKKNILVPMTRNRSLLVVEVRLDKTSKKLSHRKCLQVPQDLVAFDREDLRHALPFLQDASLDDDSYPFESINVTTLNGYMKRIADRMELKDGIPTSYSFRRCFVYVVLQYCKYDCKEATKYTLHFSTQVLQAH